ncbi:hypothetical protein LOC68_23605 [Blastopirellula sp. JC732]|uniref:Uncharacterized protein n=1 Tax=Blastopirellula sediminis TaxID=2894196 RepID=A0A9X1SJ11_9BACT|nr:hypothetical protein [Blastopirellula sediminis]MCC9605309.1 hypothetical protein [Blastopirellula sediminis]MCC9631391.1 hypothetical protein [Blastopirellula sediminis]
MMDFDVQRCTRRCAATDRELLPGETIYSVLVRDGAEVVRQDYSAEAWQGAPEGAVGWWKSELPSGKSRGPDWAPSDVMLDYFESLAEDPTKEDVRYVMALLMIRRKILRLDEADGEGEGPEKLLVYSAKREMQYEVPVASPSAARIAEIQTEVAKLLDSAA